MCPFTHIILDGISNFVAFEIKKVIKKQNYKHSFDLAF